VSPYSFEVEITTVAVLAPQKHISTNQAVKSLRSLYSEIQELVEKRQQLMQEYQEIQGNITQTMGHCVDAIEDVADDHIETEILYALLKGPMNKRVLSMHLGIPEYVLEKYIEKMEQKEVLKRDENNYIIG
jgi:ArsR family transcriptional regulator